MASLSERISKLAEDADSLLYEIGEVRGELDIAQGPESAVEYLDMAEGTLRNTYNALELAESRTKKGGL